MKKNDFLFSNWLALVERIQQQAPEFGKLTIDLIFHQNGLSKAIITNKEETIVFKKEAKNGEF